MVRMDEIDTGLPDLTGITLAELLTSNDPALLAAVQRVVNQVLAEDPDDGVMCCSR